MFNIFEIYLCIQLNNSSNLIITVLFLFLDAAKNSRLLMPLNINENHCIKNATSQAMQVSDNEYLLNNSINVIQATHQLHNLPHHSIEILEYIFIKRDLQLFIRDYQ